MTAHDRLPPGKYSLRVPDYMMLGEAGVFGERRTELIEGDVIVMAPEFRPHGRVRDDLHYEMRNVLLARKSRWSASSGSVALSDVSMWQPEGDIYRERREIAFGDPVTSANIRDLTIPTTGL